MTIPIIIAALVMSAAGILFGLAICRTAARADRQARQAHVKYLMRYEGGERPCCKCGEPTAYSLRGSAIHPHCREDIA